MSKSSLRFLRSAIVLVLASAIALIGVQFSNQQVSPALSNAPRMMGPAGGMPLTGKEGDDANKDAPPFEVVEAVKHDVSRPLRDLKPEPAQPWSKIREMPEPESVDIGAVESEVKDPVLQSSFGPVGSAAARDAMPAPVVNVNGLGNLNGVYPPDTNGDVGPNHFVQWINLSFQIFDKSGVSVYGPAAGNTLWNGFGGPCQNRNDGDPIVLYDSIADRWLMSQFTAASPYGECIAISTTGDPTGSYYRYFFQFSTNVFYDYPHLGVWPEGYYMGANRFQCNILFCSYRGPSAIVFDRARMLSGQSASFIAFNLSNSYGTLLPADLDGATLPPAGSPNFFASRGSNQIYLWRFKVNWATPSSSTLTGPTSLAVAAYSQLCSTTRSCISQPGTSVKLDGIGDRLMHRLAYRNMGAYQTLLANHSVNAGGGRAGIRWYEIRNPNGAATIFQQGTYAPNDGANRWMASLAMDKAGNIAAGYSISSSSIYPGIRYTGRLSTDPAGQLPQGEATLVNGGGSQTGSGSRWGDYAMMTVDPVDNCTFWFTTEYMPTSGTAPWQTRIGSFKFPSCAP